MIGFLKTVRLQTIRLQTVQLQTIQLQVFRSISTKYRFMDQSNSKKL